MPKVLYIVPHREGRSPGQRFRCEQYIPWLKEKGFEITYSNLITEKEDGIFYSQGNYFAKFMLLLKFFFRRNKDVRRAREFDIVFIYREAFVIGTTWFERKLKKSGAKIIFDFDDSIWLNDVSHGNRNIKWLKRPSKTADIISLSDCVFAGNRYLAEFAEKYCRNVHIIPTTIDTNYHVPKTKKANDVVCIGWTGTSTTLKHFETAIPALRKIKQAYGEKVRFKVIVNFAYAVPDLNLVADQWNIHTEIDDLAEFDIGIMPLPDDEWSKGKCGFKGLQYMSMNIPTVMSPVGVNKEIIRDGDNGYLASSESEWVEKLSTLINSADLRQKLGENGRQTIEKFYSVDSQKQIYLEFFRSFAKL